MESFFNSLYTLTKFPNKFKATLNAFDQAMDLLLSSQTRNTDENQPISNLKLRNFANTLVTRKKLKFSPEDAFLLKFI